MCLVMQLRWSLLVCYLNPSFWQDEHTLLLDSHLANLGLTLDPIVCIDLVNDKLAVARESGTVMLYQILAHAPILDSTADAEFKADSKSDTVASPLARQVKFPSRTLPNSSCSPTSIMLNCDCTRMAILDARRSLIVLQVRQDGTHFSVLWDFLCLRAHVRDRCMCHARRM